MTKHTRLRMPQWSIHFQQDIALFVHHSEKYKPKQSDASSPTHSGKWEPAMSPMPSLGPLELPIENAQIPTRKKRAHWKVIHRFAFCLRSLKTVRNQPLNAFEIYRTVVKVLVRNYLTNRKKKPKRQEKKKNTTQAMSNKVPRHKNTKPMQSKVYVHFSFKQKWELEKRMKKHNNKKICSSSACTGATVRMIQWKNDFHTQQQYRAELESETNSASNKLED